MMTNPVSFSLSTVVIIIYLVIYRVLSQRYLSVTLRPPSPVILSAPRSWRSLRALSGLAEYGTHKFLSFRFSAGPRRFRVRSAA